MKKYEIYEIYVAPATCQEAKPAQSIPASERIVKNEE